MHRYDFFAEIESHPESYHSLRSGGILIEDILDIDTLESTPTILERDSELISRSMCSDCDDRLIHFEELACIVEEIAEYLLELYLVYIDKSDLRIDITYYCDLTMDMGKEIELILEPYCEFDLFSKETHLMTIIVLYGE